MSRRRRPALVRALALLSCFCLPFGASAAEITLRMKGGGFELSGELKEYDGAKYVIISPALGSMTIDATRFDCVGDNCPKAPMSVANQPPPISPRDVRGSIAITGSNTIGNALMPAIVEGYAQKNGFRTQKVVGRDPLDLMIQILDQSGKQVATVDLRRHGSSTSFRALEAREVEIGMSSRVISEGEASKLAAVGIGDMKQATHEHVLALDGLLVIVSPDNPALSVPLEKLPAIFAGQLTDWSELGLPPGPINVYAPTQDSGTFETFDQLVLKPANAKLADVAKRTENHRQQSDWVAADPLGIGVVGIAYLRNAKALNIEMPCGLIAQPTVFGVKTEEYPLARRLYLYSPGIPKAPLARSILQFALSPEAQPIIRDVEFIDQAAEGLPRVEQNARIAFGLNSRNPEFSLEAMREFMVATRGAERLTTTLRFNTGSVSLDNKALADVRRLALMLQSDAYRQREVMLLGFADPAGAYATNLGLSRQRAEAVQIALRAEGVERAQVQAFGEMAPVACNDTPAGLAFNRRVEVWVR